MTQKSYENVYSIIYKIVFVSLFIVFYGCSSSENKDTRLFSLKNLDSRSASGENFNAEKGKGGMEKDGFKGSPAIKDFKKGSTEVLLKTNGPGMIRHIWCTVKPNNSVDLRNIIIRMYWENSQVPSVEAPLSDFFGIAHGAKALMTSELISVLPLLGYNCYILMPFKENALITITNESDTDFDWFFYQIDFTLGDNVSNADGRFHACFSRENPTKLGRDFTILETEGAKGVFIGCVLGIRPLNSGWWGEGEFKFFIDGDTKYPTICGTGMEDYIGGAWGLKAFSSPSSGAPLVEPDFVSIYRFHLNDPIYFKNKLRLTVQQMGLCHINEGLKQYGDSLIYCRMEHPRRDPNLVFYKRSDDVCAVAYWYQYPLIKTRVKFPSKQLRSGNLYVPSQKSAINAEM